MSKGKKQTSGITLNRRQILRYGVCGLVAAGIPVSLWPKRKSKKPNIILITLDTTRLDRLSCYGYHRNTSPNLDKVTAESVLYTKAIAPSSWTFPSHASLFTGKFTSSHGARYDPEGPLYLTDAITGPQAWWVYRARGMARDEITLAAILKKVGYVTAGVVGGPWMKKVFGLNKGFDYYDDAHINTLNGRLARDVTATAIKWLDRSQNKPFFLFLNYFDPHGPYIPPEGFATAFLPSGTKLDTREQMESHINELYDAEILYMDHYIGRLFGMLKANGLYDNTWIIVTSDHGELLGEHGEMGHGHYLYQEEIHIPLFMKYPNGEMSAQRVDLPVQLIDILPVVCERVGAKVPQGIQGTIPAKGQHPIIAETYPLPILSQEGSWRASFEGDFKFLWNSKGNHLLFDLGKDPRETENLATMESQRANNMLVKLDNYLAKLPKPKSAESTGQVDEETKRALKSLGYVE